MELLDVCVDAFASMSEIDLSIGGSEESVVFTHADIIAWEELSSSLSNDDGSRVDLFATVSFDAESSSYGVSSIF